MTPLLDDILAVAEPEWLLDRSTAAGSSKGLYRVRSWDPHGMDAVFPEEEAWDEVTATMSRAEWIELRTRSAPANDKTARRYWCRRDLAVCETTEPGTSFVHLQVLHRSRLLLHMAERLEIRPSCPRTGPPASVVFAANEDPTDAEVLVGGGQVPYLLHALQPARADYDGWFYVLYLPDTDQFLVTVHRPAGDAPFVPMDSVGVWTHMIRFLQSAPALAVWD